ncbi:MAG TPA: ATP-binding cassette domain-containing protein [Candidatus Thermoplasmatota archaeon]|nr:ATP-binding cassette domain-containing protein [Candidatus Thermoplasmatota archaeon]
MPETNVEQESISRNFKCPSCGHVAAFSGRPNEKVIVTCQSCNMKGTITLPPSLISPKSTNGNAIEISHLKKMFGDFTAVDDVSFTVKKGEIFGLLGPNGAGKSTIIRMLCTLTRPTAGTATVAGFNVVKQDSKVRQHIGLVSEKMIMYEELTARENLRLFGNLYNIPKDTLEKRIDELLHFVRMEKWANQRIKTFSTGMKQRINVIRALVNQPEILFLDEPTLGLDPQSTAEIRELTQRINTENGTTIILTTHIMGEADLLCKRIGIIDHGKIVALDTPMNLKKMVSGSDISAFQIEISNLDPRLIASVQSLKVVKSLVQEDMTHLLVRANGGDAFDNIVDCLRKNGAKVRMVQNLEPSLEDVFLHLTGREARDKISENAVSTTARHGPRRRRAARRIR